MTLLQVLSLVLVALGGTAVVLTRNPMKQVPVLSLYGLLLTILFLLLQAPDAAYSELVVGSAALPLMVLVTLTKVRIKSR